MKTIRKMMWAACLLLISGSAKAQDIEIRDFKQNVTSLIGSMSPVYDNTGKGCAVIRFSVRDTTFVIGGNMGVMKRTTQLGEILLYVPSETKRLTVRHAGLLPLRYEIPLKLEPKKTYDALMVAVNTPTQPIPPVKEDTAEIPTTQERKVEPKPVEEKPIENMKAGTPQLKLQKKQEKKTKKTFLVLGLGYQVMSMSGLAASIDIDANHHLVEIGVTCGLQKSDELYFYRDNDNLMAIRQYTPLRFNLRYGYELKLSKTIGISPMIGGSLNIFSSESNQGDDARYSEHYLKASSFSVMPSVRFSVMIDKYMKISVTPEYAFGVFKSDNCKLISDDDSKFKSWTDGFNVTAGISFMF